MKTNQCMDVLELHLIPSLHAQDADKFKHDDTPCYHPKKVSKMLADISVTEWSENYPDSSAIKILGGICDQTFPV